MKWIVLNIAHYVGWMNNIMVVLEIQNVHKQLPIFNIIVIYFFCIENAEEKNILLVANLWLSFVRYIKVRRIACLIIN